jgi:hypothetical protein
LNRSHYSGPIAMIFGHNTNVSLGQTTYHVQTEDAGVTSALIDTTVYCRGRVLHRRTNNYHDLLPLNPDREAALKLRLDEQHRQVLEEIRSGALYLPPPAPPAQAATPAAPAPISATPNKAPNVHADEKNIAAQQPVTLSLELLNAKTWLAGKRATLHLRVTDRSGNPVSAAKVSATVAGANEPGNFSAESDAHGEAHLAFDMPRLHDANAAIVIEAAHASAKGHLRFQLRAKQRVPVTQG